MFYQIFELLGVPLSLQHLWLRTVDSHFCLFNTEDTVSYFKCWRGVEVTKEGLWKASTVISFHVGVTDDQSVFLAFFTLAIFHSRWYKSFRAMKVK